MESDELVQVRIAAQQKDYYFKQFPIKIIVIGSHSLYRFSVVWLIESTSSEILHVGLQ